MPGWVRTSRAEAALAAMTAAERAARPSPIPLPALTDAVLDLIRDDDLAGHVVVLSGSGPAVRTREHDARGTQPAADGSGH